MALPATDTFDGSGALSASWTTTVGGFTRTSGLVSATGTTNSLAYWNADSFANDQYSKGTISGIVSYSYCGVATRCDATGDGYTLYTKDTTAYIVRSDAGSETTLDTDATSPYVSTNVIELRSEGSTHTAYNNGVAVSGFTATDSTHTTGSAGLSGYFNSPDTNLTDWEGGNTGAAGGTISTVDSPVLDGETGNTLTTTGFAGEPTTLTVEKTGGTHQINIFGSISGTGGSYTFDMPNVAAYTSDTAGTPFDSASHTHTITVGDGTSTDNEVIVVNPKVGWAVVEVNTAIKTEGSVFEGWTGTPANTDQVYYPTANNTSVAANGTLTTDQTVGTIGMVFFDTTDSTWKPFDVIISASSTSTWFNRNKGKVIGYISPNKRFTDKH